MPGKVTTGLFKFNESIDVFKPDQSKLSKIISEAEALITELKQILTGEELESYADYPDAVSNNAKRGIELNEKVNILSIAQGKFQLQFSELY